LAWFNLIFFFRFLFLRVFFFVFPLFFRHCGFFFFVFASVSEAIQFDFVFLDCFVAKAPRKDGEKKSSSQRLGCWIYFFGLLRRQSSLQRREVGSALVAGDKKRKMKWILINLFASLCLFFSLSLPFFFVFVLFFSVIEFFSSSPENAQAKQSSLRLHLFSNSSFSSQIRHCEAKPKQSSFVLFFWIASSPRLLAKTGGEGSLAKTGERAPSQRRGRRLPRKNERWEARSSQETKRGKMVD